MDENEDVVVAVITAETSQGSISSSARRAYGGFQCNECRRVCGVVDNDGRCQSCGPLPIDKPELTDAQRARVALLRERKIAERIRRERL